VKEGSRGTQFARSRNNKTAIVVEAKRSRGVNGASYRVG